MQQKKMFPLVTVDVALFTVEHNKLKVLVVRRQEEPFADCWSLPGGFLQPSSDRCILDAAYRVMRSKVGVALPLIEEIATFSGADRDPRGWSISALHMSLLPADRVSATVGKRIQSVEWMHVDSPDHELAFDHGEMLKLAVTCLRDKYGKQALPLHMLPEKFTLTQLQKVCEVIQGKKLDKSAFRKRLKDYHSVDIKEVFGEFEGGSQRPAQLWQSNS